MDGDPNVAGWLTSAARALFAAGHRTHPRHEHQRAAELGAQAAAASLTPTNLIEAFLDAASLTAQDDPDLSAADLVAMTRHLAVAAIDGYQQHTRSELAQRDRDREQFVTDLLTGRADAGRLAARAQRYGIRLSAQHTVAVAHAPGVTVDLVHTIDDALAARFGAGNTLTSVHNGDLVCLYAGGLRGVPAELAHHLLTRLGSEGWQIGVGRPHPGPHGLVTSLGEARDTLDLAGRLGFSTPVLHAADLLVFPVLLRDRDAITDLVHTVLGPLTRARGGAQPLLDTLSVLFDQQGNHTATARAMHISVRAVTYRLDRIKALTGYHPNEPTQRFTLHTAVLGARLLDWPATHAAKQE